MQAVAMCVGLLLFSVAWAAPMLSEEDSTNRKGSAHGHITASVYPELSGDKGAENVENALLNLLDPERQGAVLARSVMQSMKRPVTGIGLSGDKNKEKKPKVVPSMTPADFSDAKDHLKDEKNQERYLPCQNSPVKSKSSHQIRRSTHYLTYLPQVRTIPSDFEGSGSPDTQVRGDNEVPPYSGDGQHFMYVPGKGGAVGPGLDDSASHMGLSGSDKAEIVNPHMSGLGSNEIPERERHGGDAGATRDKTAQRAGAAGESLVEGSNDITGSTSFRELPGKEGNRIDAGSQNAHQGKLEFHYPQVPSREKLKGGCSDNSGSASYNEIPKRSKGRSRTDTEVTLTDKQRFSSKGKSQSLVLPSHSLGNEVKSKGDSSNDLSHERITMTNSRKSLHVHHALDEQNNSTWNKGGMSQRRGGTWPSRRSHAHRRFSTGRRDSSESSSGSSSESEGD